jgi:hypothetical protein
MNTRGDRVINDYSKVINFNFIIRIIFTNRWFWGIWFYAFFPIINDYILDFSALPEIVSDFFQIFGGVANYEAYIQANPNIPNIPVIRF